VASEKNKTLFGPPQLPCKLNQNKSMSLVLSEKNKISPCDSPTEVRRIELFLDLHTTLHTKQKHKRVITQKAIHDPK
jgi:hypothetical protein